MRARDCGMEVVYEGIRLTPERIVNAALEESVHVVGLSILSGGHVSLVAEVLERHARRPASATCRWWSAASSRRPTPRRCSRPASPRVYTPKDFDLTQIMRDIVAVVDERLEEAA